MLPPGNQRRQQQSGVKTSLHCHRLEYGHSSRQFLLQWSGRWHPFWIMYVVLAICIPGTLISARSFGSEQTAEFPFPCGSWHSCFKHGWMNRYLLYA